MPSARCATFSSCTSVSDSFLQIQTALEPEPLLDLCKKIEDKLGRTPTIRHGPRTVDLDIIFYDHIEFKTKRLTIPHPLLQERAFVLGPLCEYVLFAIFPV